MLANGVDFTIQLTDLMRVILLLDLELPDQFIQFLILTINLLFKLTELLLIPRLVLRKLLFQPFNGFVIVADGFFKLDLQIQILSLGKTQLLHSQLILSFQLLVFLVKRGKSIQSLVLLLQNTCSVYQYQVVYTDR